MTTEAHAFQSLKSKKSNIIFLILSCLLPPQKTNKTKTKQINKEQIGAAITWSVTNVWLALTYVFNLTALFFQILRQVMKRPFVVKDFFIGQVLLFRAYHYLFKLIYNYITQSETCSSTPIIFLNTYITFPSLCTEKKMAE